MATGRVVAFEALARWTHAGSVVPPDQFIPVAARTGVLSELTDHVMAAVCAQLATWTRLTGRPDLEAAVNVPQPGDGPVVPDRVGACNDRNGLAPRQLVLEVTEDALLGDAPTARAVAHGLSEAGASLPLDDFGTGWSSRVHLRRMPVESVETDRVFAVDLDRDPEVEPFVRALQGLGRDLGLTVVVGGVEGAAQADVLRRPGAPLAQGWFFAPPAPAAEIERQLALGALVLRQGRSSDGPRLLRAALTDDGAADPRRRPGPC